LPIAKTASEQSHHLLAIFARVLCKWLASIGGRC